jgi:hypothetical protein
MLTMGSAALMIAGLRSHLLSCYMTLQHLGLQAWERLTALG